MVKQRITLLLLVVFALASPVVVFAQTNGTPEETRAIKDDFEQLKRNPEFMQQMILALQMALGHLGYGAGPFTGEYDEQTKRAIAKFKANRDGHASDGELDGETMVQVFDAFKATNKPDVTLPRFNVSTDYWDSFVLARGTMIIERQEQGIPLQTEEIQCHRNLGACIEATAMLQGEDYLTSWLELYEIERWDDYEIVTKPRDLHCVRYTLRINRMQKTVTGLRTTIRTTDACKAMSQEDIRLRLVDGLTALKNYDAKGRKDAKKYMQFVVPEGTQP